MGEMENAQKRSPIVTIQYEIDGWSMKKEKITKKAGIQVKKIPSPSVLQTAAQEKKFITPKTACVLLFVFWIPIIMCCLPGNMMWDTGSGISQFLKVDYVTPNNPYFLNFLFGSVVYIGQLLGNANIAVMIYCLLQSGITIFLLANGICGMGRINQYAGYFLLIFYGLVPVYSIYSMSMSKDSCLAAAVLLYVVLALQSFREQDFWQNDRNTLMFSLSILLMTLTRNHSGWVPAIVFVLYSVFVLKQKNMIIKSTAVLLLVAFFALFLPAALRIPPTESKEGMSIPLQTMAYYAKTHPEDVSEEDKAVISQVLPYETMIESYDPWIADPIKNIANFSGETTGPFIRLWFQKLLRHPETMAEGFYKSTYIYVSPAEYCTVKLHVWIGYEIANQGALGLSNNNPNRSTLRDYFNGWLETPVIHLFVKIGLFSILLGVCILLMIIFKQGRYMLCIAPLLMIFIGCLLSPVNGYYRYAYPMIIGIPVLFADLLVTVVRRLKCSVSGKK